MRTFTSIHTYPIGSCGYDKNERMIFLVEADPKREGLYKMSQFQTEEGKKPRRYSIYYGKCNQGNILEATKKMIEVK